MHRELGEGQSWLRNRNHWALSCSDRKRGNSPESWSKPRPWLSCCVCSLFLCSFTEVSSWFLADGRCREHPPKRGMGSQGDWGGVGRCRGLVSLLPCPVVPRVPVWRCGAAPSFRMRGHPLACFPWLSIQVPTSTCGPGRLAQQESPGQWQASGKQQHDPGM